MVKRYFIETVRSGRTNGGMGCGGWHPGPVIAEIKVKTEDGEHFYLSVVQLSDGVCYYKTEESTFDKQIEEIDDQDFWDSLNDRIIIFGESFDELLLDSFGDPFIFLYKYLSVIVKEPKECEIVHVNQYVDDILEHMMDND